jgi:hypothetical protein
MANTIYMYYFFVNLKRCLYTWCTYYVLTLSNINLFCECDEKHYDLVICYFNFKFIFEPVHVLGRGL